MFVAFLQRFPSSQVMTAIKRYSAALKDNHFDNLNNDNSCLQQFTEEVFKCLRMSGNTWMPLIYHYFLLCILLHFLRLRKAWIQVFMHPDLPKNIEEKVRERLKNAVDGAQICPPESIGLNVWVHIFARE